MPAVDPSVFICSVFASLALDLEGMNVGSVESSQVKPREFIILSNTIFPYASTGPPSCAIST